MRLNKTVKALSVALPLMTLAACSSNSSKDGGDSQVTNQPEEVVEVVEEVVEVSPAERQRRIAEEKRQQLEVLMAENTIFFAFDQSTISDDYANLLDAHAAYLSVNPEVNALIAGYTDDRGTPEYNIALGERRAKAVVSYLEALGVDAGQLSTVSYGEEKPLSKGHTESDYAKNRRAMIVYR